MSSTTDHAPTSGHHEDEGNYLTNGKGIASWMLTLDHKRIGIMYLVAVLTFFVFGGVLALLVRTQLLTPEGLLFSQENYNKVFTLHGAVMVFVFIIPSVPAALGNFLLPLMLGAKDVAFPRLNLASWYIYLMGSTFLIYSILAGSMDTGWTFYTPYSIGPSDNANSIIAATMGVFILGFSSILTGVNFIATIHKMRAPGMTWMKMPLMVWALYATSVIQVLATPVLAITLLLLVAERFLGIGIFDPSLGGDPVLYQHFFWFYSHPAVYIMILPGFGIISELITVHSRKRIFGYSFIAFSSVSIAAIGFLVWGHHMFVSGQSELASTVFSFLTFAVAVPTAIKVFSWVATLYGGSIRFTAPMLYALFFIFIFSIGGLTGVFLGTLAVDVHMHDTYFVVAHFHYVMMGGLTFALMGGLFHWWPKMSGKMYNTKAAAIASWTTFIGFNLTFLTQFVLGSQGMPRRYASYDMVSPELLPMFQKLHFWSTIGSYILGLGFMISLVTLAHAWFKGKTSPHNPWGGVSMEWQTATPPITHNFHGQPVCTHGPYEFPEIDTSAESAH
jgi:cytochrome c oxidase subunit 1